MKTPQTNLPPEVHEILTALMSGVRSALADNLIGVYLRGSLATGDFVDTSDVDVLVATERPVSDAEADALIQMHARLAALPNPYVDRLEGAYIDRAALRRFEPGRRFLTIECETPLRWKVHETSWLIERWVLHEKGVALLGPGPKTLIDPISTEELRDAVRLRVREWATWAADPHDPEWLPPRSHQAYVVETIYAGRSTRSPSASSPANGGLLSGRSRPCRSRGAVSWRTRSREGRIRVRIRVRSWTYCASLNGLLMMGRHTSPARARRGTGHEC